MNKAIDMLDQLLKLPSPAKFPINDIHKMLLKKDEWLFSGMAELVDPIYNNVAHLLRETNYDHHEVLCGVTLNKTTIIWVMDPQDGYRSSCDEVIVVPNQTLKTALPFIPVSFRLKENERDEDSPTPNNPFYIEALCKTTGNVLFQAGTEVSDSYYPMAVGYFDVRNIDLSAKLHTKTLLTQHTEESKKGKSLNVQKKKM